MVPALDYVSWGRVLAGMSRPRCCGQRPGRSREGSCLRWGGQVGPDQVVWWALCVDAEVILDGERTPGWGRWGGQSKSSKDGGQQVSGCHLWAGQDSSESWRFFQNYEEGILASAEEAKWLLTPSQCEDTWSVRWFCRETKHCLFFELNFQKGCLFENWYLNQGKTYSEWK